MNDYETKMLHNTAYVLIDNVDEVKDNFVNFYVKHTILRCINNQNGIWRWKMT